MALGKIGPKHNPLDPREIYYNYKQELIKLSDANARKHQLQKALEEMGNVNINEYNLSITEQAEIKKWENYLKLFLERGDYLNSYGVLQIIIQIKQLR